VVHVCRWLNLLEKKEQGGVRPGLVMPFVDELLVKMRSSYSVSRRVLPVLHILVHRVLYPRIWYKFCLVFNGQSDLASSSAEMLVHEQVPLSARRSG